ncbi:laminin subunit gamma-3 isoform X1 [Brienomyrus brachyistius]|uniref:laminin subunit gamma-3 isoform X1 n=1 Tax=Brienomyrus brachyistius TaxID=42636 RepID=UPI0020B17A66|nr:laminin subunit gamma-3 isoform X1 [Brienomyrus brachyistius]
MEPLLALLPLTLLHATIVSGAMDSCYDDRGSATRCMPRFENAAFERTVLASNVCGTPPEDYCTQAGSSRSCSHCDASDPRWHHNVTFLTDFHSDEEPSWWQSQSMFYGVQYPQSVNLTLHLGKAFEITYIRLKFHTSRPESFAIYKRSQEAGPWLPYQYYSGSCQRTYEEAAKGYLQPGDDERTALCTDEFSDISPLTGGNVAFSTLEGRPSAYNFDQSPVLQEWVTATDLLISLVRLNTFGDEFFKDSKVLRSYYYAISDFSVGGRCKCNGHASECVQGEHGKVACACEHHTTGTDCQECQPFYQDRPWARATADSANECQLCNCSGRADQCVFDAELYRSTGSGGRCVGCQDNTDGPHCERCRENFHRDSPQDDCHPCNCNALGSLSLQCTPDGRCPCRHTVSGEKCDICQPGFHTLGVAGCRPCECHPEGSVGICTPQDGRCHCKVNVEGQACDRCKPGFFNLDAQNPKGCESCFCFGHSVACSSAPRYSEISITSDFHNDPDGWTGEFLEGQASPLLWKEGEVYLLPYTEDDLGFYVAPEKFLGNRLLSYGQLLSLNFVAESPELLPQQVTLVLEGSSTSILAELLPESSLHTAIPEHTFTLRLHEEEGRLRPSLSSSQLRSLLYNVTALKISNAGGLNYTSQLSRVSLASAAPSSAPSAPVSWVEMCSCPQGFEGQHCERCARGYRREVPSEAVLSRCVPCTCNQHGHCHAESGVCQCTDFTTGASCERCLDGYYGNALMGSPSDCQPCPCPEQTSCAQVPETGEVICTNCPAGRRGTRCEMCDDGFYGDPLGRYGPLRPCTSCECHGNADYNAVGVCDHLSGRCLKCLHHTEGDHCERCRRGYYGNAMAQSSADKCKPCLCNPEGTAGSPDDCHPSTGQCLCLDHVSGRDCTHCQMGYFNLKPGVGCERCTCSPTGSSSAACHPITGQCVCRPGVEGLSCDSCRTGFFGLSTMGCRACNCYPMGSVTMQCYNNGTCSCREGFMGYKCDQCEPNYFHNRATHQCEECPICYSLVRDQAKKLKERLQDLEKLLSRYNCGNRRALQYQSVQGEDALPNMIMELLAVQDAKEGFVSQFTQLETSAQLLELQLHNIRTAMNCSHGLEAEEEREAPHRSCRALVISATAVGGALKRLGQVAQTLDKMVIPFDIPKEPNQWAQLVNKSHVLGKGHEEVAGHIENVTKKALETSNQAFNDLMMLLEDNSTEQFMNNLTQQFLEMQLAKENLTAGVNDTLTDAKAADNSVQAQMEETASSLSNLTSSVLPHWHAKEVDLGNRTQELQLLDQSKDELVTKIREELEPSISGMETHLETIQQFDQLTAQVREAKLTALSAIVEAKESDSEAITLLKRLDAIQKEWPEALAQAQTFSTKEKMVEEKLLADASKKVSQAERMLKPALENTSACSNTAAEARDAASSASKEAKDLLHKTRRTGSSSAQLSSSVDTVLLQLEIQEYRAAQIHMEDSSQIEGIEGDMKAAIESAKAQLETHTHMLTDLLQKIAEENDTVQKFDVILNETAIRLGILRHTMESPALGVKIQALRDAASDQRAQLEQVERSVREITEEKQSLLDIALHLPQRCPEESKISRP